MSDKTLMNGAAQGTATVGDVSSHASSLAYDLITLAELQAKLLYMDVREAGSRSAASGVSLAAMMALAVSSLPVILLGAAEWIGDSMGLSRGAANLLVGGFAGSVAMIAAWISFQRLRRVTAVFSRSQQELQENLEFIKSLVGDSNDSRKSLSR